MGRSFAVCCAHVALESTWELINRTVSQFTLLATTKKGNKPDFHKSAPPIPAKELYDRFFAAVQAQYRPDRVKDGVFQAMMDVSLINDGPVGVDYSCEDGVVNLSLASLSYCLPMVILLTGSIGYYPDRDQPTTHGQPY